MHPNADSPSTTFSLLLIDANDEDRVALRRLLDQGRSGLKFDIREADTGAHGLALCRERPPDCLLLDYSLDDMGGRSLLTELNAGRATDDEPLCPVVILTDAGTVVQATTVALKGGAQDCLVKETLTSEGITRAVKNATEKVRLRRERRAAEARFRASLDNMTDCFGLFVAVREPESGTILDFRCEYVNDAACRSNRMLREEHVGRLLVAELFPAHRASGLFDEYVRVVETGEPLERIEFSYGDTILGGRLPYFDGAFDLRAWKMGDGFAVTWHEVTDRKRIEEELRLTTDRFRLTLKDSQIIVFSQDLDLRYTWIYNPALGYDAAAVLGKRDADLFERSEDAAITEAIKRDVIRSGINRRQEVQIRAVGVDRCYDLLVAPLLDAAGRIAGVTCVAVDITDRKGAEEALRESRIRLAVGMEVAGLAVAEVDYATGLNHLSAEAAQLFGLGESAVAVPREAVHATFHPKDRAELMRGIAASLDPTGVGWFAMDHRVVWPNGEVHWLRVRKQVFFEGEGDARRAIRAILAALDVTPEKNAEEQRNEAEERLRFAVNSSEAGVYEVDYTTGRKLYARRTFELIGIPWPEFGAVVSDGTAFAPVEAREFWDRVHPADRERVAKSLREAYDLDSRTAGAYQSEYRVRLADGAERWIASQGRVTFDSTGRRPVRLAGLLQDITDRKREQQTVQQLAAVVEGSADFIGIATTEGMSLFVNEAGRRLAGLGDLDAVRCVRITDYFFPEDVPTILAVIEKALTQGRETAELRLRHFVTGEPIDAQWNVMAIRDTTTGQPYAIATVTRDIREQKRIEAERAEISAKRQWVADAVQRSLLLAPPPDAYPGLTVKTFYHSAWDEAVIGGDFFDVFAVSEDLVALIVGDATGKGVEAATYTAEIKFALRAFLREHKGDLPTALRLLNNFMIDNERFDAAHSRGSCIALTAVMVSTRTNEAWYACAGAEPPLVVRAGTGEVVEPDVFGLLLGASEDATYTATRIDLGTGDLIALTTDGVTEARRPPAPDADGRMRHGPFFGIEGLVETLREEASDSTRPLGDVERSIVGRTLAWAGGRQHDDVCLLLARRR